MEATAGQALSVIRRCVAAERFTVARHFTERMEGRGLVWADVLAVMDRASNVRDGGLERFGRPKWIVAGDTADGLPLEIVCVLDTDERTSGRSLSPFIDIRSRLPMATKTKSTKRRGRPAAQRLSQPDYPYTMKLTDGRTLFVEVPGRWVTTDRGGEVVFLPKAVYFLDRVRVLAGSLRGARATPSPGYITTLREALGLTQEEMGHRVGVDKMTVSRWERGALQPSSDSLEALEKLRRSAGRSGVVIPSGRIRPRRT